METTLQVTTNSLPSTAPGQVKQKHEGKISACVVDEALHREDIKRVQMCWDGKNTKKTKTTDKEEIRLKPENWPGMAQKSFPPSQDTKFL